jgi:hypothetical protein
MQWAFVTMYFIIQKHCGDSVVKHMSSFDTLVCIQIDEQEQQTGTQHQSDNANHDLFKPATSTRLISPQYVLSTT